MTYMLWQFASTL